ncbi:hypothetical protein [Streptomyces sp. NPDC013489]|uniref:hypothetical protein n=1 Tax=Streptomyces sp. NPDC013489 TaxID=3155606 RepID=UPI00340F1E3F
MVGGEKEAQAGVQGPDPRAVLLDAISTALNAAGYWLPIEGKKAVVEAVLALQEQARVPAATTDEELVDQIAAAIYEWAAQPHKWVGAHDHDVLAYRGDAYAVMPIVERLRAEDQASIARVRALADALVTDSPDIAKRIRNAIQPEEQS